MVVNDVDDDLPAIENNVEDVGANDEIVDPPERATHRYGLRSALREVKLGRGSHRNRFEREFQYI